MSSGSTPLALADLLADPTGQAWAILWREGQDEAEVLRGEVLDIETLAQIPAPGPDAPVLALVPYRQIAERGVDARDDGTPLRVLRATQAHRISVADLIEALPSAPVPVGEPRFSVSDADYAGIVADVIEKEIGTGEGANFVIRRDVIAAVPDTEPAVAALTWLRTLLTDETGAYWTFAVHAPAQPGSPGGAHTLVGATPERHVSVADGRVRMNPISGTFRYPADDGDLVADFTSFIADTKETEELFMVVDEEMKMMSQICSDGGRITGPYLKQMAHLTHTEYLLDGRSDADIRDVLRATMFAPTVTGSPMENACTVIARHEPDGRGYYSGVLALIDVDESGAERLDAPILIRTAHLDGSGTVRISAGATLVRHSDPASEVAETTAKASGMMAALGLRPRREHRGTPRLMDLPGVAESLAQRNHSLSPFWLAPQEARPDAPLTGRSVLLVDAEDTWTQMLAHMVRHFGMVPTVRRWEQVTDADVAAADLTLFGPGPGDPTDRSDPRIARLGELIEARVASGRPLVAVCLSHQILADLAGLRVIALQQPHQGVQLPIDLWGQRALIGFYNTFVATAGSASLRGPDGAAIPLQVATHLGDDQTVVALRGSGVATLQGHAESVLSQDGLSVVHHLVTTAFGVAEDAIAPARVRGDLG